MGDTRPFNINFRINHDILAKIFDVQITIDLVHAFPCKGFALFCHGVCDFFKFGKHGLAEECTAELLQEIVDEIFPHGFILSCFQKMLHQQGFIAGRSYLCNENLMVGIKKGLLFPCEEAVQGMPHFMRKSKHAVDGIVMVEQNKGMYAVAAPGIRTAALALVFVNINPAAFHTVRQSLAVLLAHYLQCLFYGYFCLLIRNLDICIGYKRNI